MTCPRAALGLALLLFGCFDVGPGPDDGSAPLVAISAPVHGATVRGTVVIDIAAVDDFGVDRIRVFVDNALLQDVFTPPFRVSWNTIPLADNSQHVIRVEAQDAAKNTGLAQITVTVVNGTQ